MNLKKIRPGTGETLVEILASSAIFLLMMAIMQGAVVFCSNAQKKNRQIRNVNTEICQNFRTAEEITEAGSATFQFQASGISGETGSVTLFEVTAGLGEKTVHYQDEAGNESSTVFYLFYPEPSSKSSAPGGDNP